MNLRQIYEKLRLQAERNGHQIDEDRLRQQAWMIRDRMMFEQSYTNTVPSSSAAGAGGGGLRRQPIQPIVDVSIIQSTLYYELEDNKLSYFVYNFETKKLSDIILISSYVDSIDNSFVLTGVGYGFRIETGDSTEVIYINNDGVIVWRDSVDSYENDYVEGKYMIVKYRKGTSYFLSILDYLGKHRIIEIDSSIEFGDSINGGFTLRLNNEYFILKDGSNEIISLGEGNFETNQNSNKIVNTSGDIMVYDIDGALVSSYMTEDSLDDYYSLLDGSFFLILRTNNDEIKVLFFSGISNSFSERIFPNLSYDVDRGDQRSSTSTRNRLAEGAGAIYLYNQSVEYILPIWSTDEQIRQAYEVNNINIIDGLDDSNFTITRSKDFINVLIIDNNSDEFYSILRLNRVGSPFDILPTGIESDWELRDDDQINEKTIIEFRKEADGIRKVSIIGLDGTEIDSIIANNSSFDNAYRGSTYIFISNADNKTWVSNDTNGKKFIELDKYYGSYQRESNYITETGIRLGNYVLYNSGELENIIITSNSISKEFSPITSGYDFFKVDERYIFENGCLLICSGLKNDLEIKIVEYYNLNGDLIFKKELELFRLFDGTFNVVNQIGKRSSIIWSYEDNIKNIIFFKGDSVFEFNTGLTGDINYLINDYIWWD